MSECIEPNEALVAEMYALRDRLGIAPVSANIFYREDGREGLLLTMGKVFSVYDGGMVSQSAVGEWSSGAADYAHRYPKESTE